MVDFRIKRINLKTIAYLLEFKRGIQNKNTSLENISNFRVPL